MGANVFGMVAAVYKSGLMADSGWLQLVNSFTNTGNRSTANENFGDQRSKPTQKNFTVFGRQRMMAAGAYPELQKLPRVDSLDGQPAAAAA